MPTLETGPVKIHYAEAGAGTPMLVLPGGGLNGTIAKLDGPNSFNALHAFADSHRVIAVDHRNADGGGSSGPLEVDRPWDAFTDDQLALMDHLGADKFVVMGYCIGGPMIWNLIKRAPERVIAAVLVHPSGFRPELPDVFYDMNMTNWAPPLCAARDDVSMETCEAFLTRMYRANPDFVFTVDRDFVRGCDIPLLVLPDDSPPHPFAPAMETALLAPNAQASLFPWREPAERIPLALRHVRMFLAAQA